MIINHRYRFIFVKTRKTAGTSIEIALSGFCGEDDVISPLAADDEALRTELGLPGPMNHLAPDGQLRFRNHMPAEEIRDAVGADLWAAYHTFSIERNPWDKAISMYYWKSRDGRKRRVADFRRKSLPDFLAVRERQILAGTRPNQFSNFPIYSIAGTPALDHIGRYEDLTGELVRIAQTIGLPSAIALPETKSSSRTDRRPYQDVMGRAERAVIDRLCAREIDHFGYRFEDT